MARLLACTSFLIDLDGTLYLDEELLPGALELLALLDERDHGYVFLTNNSSHSGHAYRERLARLGIEVARDRILTSGDATIDFVLNKTRHRSCYLVGTPGLEADVREAGLELDADAPDCVIVGYDTTFDYAKLEVACRLVARGLPYYATHPDKTCITSRGLVPDIAAIIAAIEAVVGKLPKIIGKPQPEMVEAALRRLGSEAETTAILGDQLDTDMTMAHWSGLCAVLMMSGETTPEKLAAWPQDQRPALVATDIGQVHQWLVHAD